MNELMKSVVAHFERYDKMEAVVEAARELTKHKEIHLVVGVSTWNLREALRDLDKQ